MLTIEELKKEYIDKVLAATNLPFAVFTDTGDFQKAIRQGNQVTEYINGLLTVSGSSTEYAGEQKIISISTELRFIVRIDDDHNADGSFNNIKNFRELLSAAFQSVEPQFTAKDKDDKQYRVVVGYTLPATGTREQRSLIGDSLTYSCSVYFAYLANSINASDVKLTIDGEQVYFLAIGLTRRPSLVANLFTGSTNGESAVYAESAGFVVDLTLPAFITVMGGTIADYILGIEEANTPHTVVLDYGGNGEKTVTKTMIFGESSGTGQGIENIRYTVSLVPYATEAITGG